jgi:Na+-translocating ferredoxin:NAD+ oxidoreductase RnfC subunit
MARPVHSVIEGRHVPVKRLMARLKLNVFENKGPLLSVMPQSPELTILLRQHIGAPARPIVSKGQRVSVGEVIADIGEKELGVPIHASVDGVVEAVTENAIVLRR